MPADSDRPSDELTAPHRYGSAGASARREGEQRRARREQRQATHQADVRERHPHIGGLLLAMEGTPTAPTHERAWEKGAVGEEQIGRMLDRECPQLPILHDRRIPRSRANIDHIVVAANGIWVIDTKRYKGRVQVRQPWLGKPTLTVAGRNQTKLLEGLDRQVTVVGSVVGELGMPVTVRGGLCFVDSQWSLFARPQILNGFWVGWPKALAGLLNQAGGLTPEGRCVIAEHLANALPAA